MKKFHHVEFYCGDATATASRFMFGLGMNLVAKSDQVCFGEQWYLIFVFFVPKRKGGKNAEGMPCEIRPPTHLRRLAGVDAEERGSSTLDG